MPSDLILETSRPSFARLHDWFGFWAMHEPQAVGLFNQVRRTDLKLHVGNSLAAVTAPKERDRLLYSVEDGVAIIEIVGTMMKYSDSFGDGASTILARRAIRAAMGDPNVRGILIKFDTPGGTVSGTNDLAADIAAADKVKPTWGYIEDLCCSAGYYAAAQCSQVRINANGYAGSIGVYMVVEDLSGLAEMMQVKVHVIKAGEFKGAGVEGTPITDQQLAEWQRHIDKTYGMFIDAVAAGRKLDRAKVEALGDGRVHMGDDAVKLGLVDRVSTLDETLADLRALAATRSNSGVTGKGQKAMSNENPAAPQAATLTELKAACEGASAEFLLGQLEAGATTQSAMKAWNAKLRADLAAQQQATAAAEEKAKQAETKASTAPTKPTEQLGVKPVTAADDDEPSTSATDEWNAAVAAEKKAGKSNQQAVIAANQKHPGLREKMLAEVNADRRRK